ncbi:MAG: hypothetical protein ABI462_10180 [Ignavibacteria bacterium]
MSKSFFDSAVFNLILAVMFGIIISYIDLHNTDVQPAVMLLVIFSFMLGYKDPPRAWLYSCMLALSIIAGYLISRLAGFEPEGPPPDNLFWTLLAFIPSFAGGYAGVLIKILFKKTIS